jgi:hypothetical protein
MRLPLRTIAEFFYIVVSTVGTFGVTWAAAWGYPQGREVIWPVGLGSMLIVVVMGIKPLMLAWAKDRAALEARTDG